MRDYTAWLKNWSDYYTPPKKTVPLTTAELAANQHWGWFFIALIVAVIVGAILVVAYILKQDSDSDPTWAVVGVIVSAILVLAPLMWGAVTSFTGTEKTITVDVSEPASFIAQTEKTFGVRNLYCPSEVMRARGTLPDKGSYRCTVTGGENDSLLRNVTLVVTENNRIGLYDEQGKAVNGR